MRCDPASTAVLAAAERIDDAGDPRLDDYRDLKDADLRRRRGLFAVEGREIVRRLLAARRFRTRSVLITEPALASIAPFAAASGTRVYLAPVAVVQSVVGYAFHRGCVAVAERGPALAARALTGPPGPRLIVVAEDIANPDNVGGVFRNALAFGADAVLLSRGCADPLYRKAIRVSAGASVHVPFATFDDCATAPGALRAAGYCVIALTADAGAVDIARIGRDCAVPERLALVVGSEDRGLRKETRAAADLEVTIPMTGAADSLNAATAVAIALHRLCRLEDAKVRPGRAFGSGVRPGLSALGRS